MFFLCRKTFQCLKSNSFLKRVLIILSIVFSMRGINMGGLEAAPQGPVTFNPVQPGAMCDPDMADFVHSDDDGNIYFDIYPLYGAENKIMFAKNGVLVVTVQPPEELQETLEKGLWNFISSILGVTATDFEILMFPADSRRRVLIKEGKLTEKDCQDRIKDVLKPYIPSAGQTPGQTEPPPLLTPYNLLAIYAQNDTNQKEGPLKYYEVIFPKEEKAAKRAESIPRKKLVEMKPYYSKDPSWMAKILRDLRINQGIVIRGRLLPGIPFRPILDDYRGPKKVKLVRKILEGIADGSGIPSAKSKLRYEMSHPVPATMMLDFLNQDKTAIISRRVVSPLFRNDTVDLVEEFEYTEVV